MRDRFGLDELYVADLDAIAGRTRERDVVAALAREARVMVDAGTADAKTIARLLELGVARVVIGTESLPGAEAFRRLRSELPDAPLVLSLDLRGGRADLARPRAVAASGAADALARLADAGAREVIVLDLAPRRLRRGTRRDAARASCTPASPTSSCSPGGGVRDAADLRALADAGAAGALVATALHNGTIAADELHALR